VSCNVGRFFSQSARLTDRLTDGFLVAIPCVAYYLQLQGKNQLRLAQCTVNYRLPRIL